VGFFLQSSRFIFFSYPYRIAIVNEPNENHNSLRAAFDLRQELAVSRTVALQITDTV